MTLPYRTLLCFGEVLSSWVVCDSNGEPKGYEFSTLEAAELAIKMLDAWIFSIYMPLHAQQGRTDSLTFFFLLHFCH